MRPDVLKALVDRLVNVLAVQMNLQRDGVDLSRYPVYLTLLVTITVLAILRAAVVTGAAYSKALRHAGAKESCQA